MFNRNKIVGHGVPLAAIFGLGLLAGLGVTAKAGIPENSTAAAILMGAIASSIATLALLLGWKTIRANRHNARAALTYQHIAKTQADKDFIEARKLVRQAVKDGNLAQYAQPENDASDITAAIGLLLNDLELTAIGIKRGIIDCQLYRSWCESSVVRRWREAAEFVSARRARFDTSKIYCELEEMAKAWDKKRHGYKFDPNSPFCKGGPSSGE